MSWSMSLKRIRARKVWISDFHRFLLLRVSSSQNDGCILAQLHQQWIDLCLWGRTTAWPPFMAWDGMAQNQVSASNICQHLCLNGIDHNIPTTLVQDVQVRFLFDLGDGAKVGISNPLFPRWTNHIPELPGRSFETNACFLDPSPTWWEFALHNHKHSHLGMDAPWKCSDWRFWWFNLLMNCPVWIVWILMKNTHCIKMRLTLVKSKDSTSLQLFHIISLHIIFWVKRNIHQSGKLWSKGIPMNEMLLHHLAQLHSEHPC